MSDDGYINGLEKGIVVERAELNLVAFLSPKLTIDGNMWCWLYGENLQDGVAGFGDSPYLAALDFNRAFYAKMSPPKPNDHT